MGDDKEQTDKVITLFAGDDSAEQMGPVCDSIQTAVHKLTQLSKWWPSNDAENLDLGARAASIFKHIHHTTEVGDLTLENCDQKLQLISPRFKEIQIAADAWVKLGKEGAIAKLGWVLEGAADDQKADVVWTAARTTHDHFKYIVAKLIELKSTELQPHLAKFNAALTHFDMSATEKMARSMKTLQGTVDGLVMQAIQSFPDFGIDMPELFKDAQTSLSKSAIIMVQWGVAKLITNADIGHVEAGKDLRANLTTIQEQYAIEYGALPEEMKQSVITLMEIDAPPANLEIQDKPAGNGEPKRKRAQTRDGP